MSSAARKKVIAIGGPTASGKTALAIELAMRFETDIISADSRQVYRQMSIGTAKPTPEELAKVKHHCIDILDVDEPFSAGDFERTALAIIENIHQTRDVVIMAGGTGFYHKAVLEGFDEMPHVPNAIREKWDSLFQTEGIAFLQEAVKTRDPLFYENTDPKNHRRLIRALSVMDVTGRKFSKLHTDNKTIRPFTATRIFLNYPREFLYRRIDERVDRMIEAGLLDEVRSLLPYRNLQSLQTVGYQELFPYFDGRISLENAIKKIKQHSRNYAKRQVTWYRNQGEWKEVMGGEEIGLIIEN